MSAPEPILVPCEGSGGPSAVRYQRPSSVGLCEMCGRWKPMADGVLPEHDRWDITAMVERGDFA